LSEKPVAQRRSLFFSTDRKRIMAADMRVADGFDALFNMRFVNQSGMLAVLVILDVSGELFREASVRRGHRKTVQGNDFIEFLPRESQPML
jgi:hypothetical protein